MARAATDSFAPRLMPIAIPAVAGLCLVGLLAVWIYRYMMGLSFQWIPWPIESPHVSSSDAFKNSVAILGLMGAVLTGIYAYRKQILAEAEARRADAIDFSRRYGEALTQLGNDRAAVRLGGAYAMARLADQWKEQRQNCIDVLCAYLRMPENDELSERVVRRTVQTLIINHMDPLAAHSMGYPYWCAYNIDLSGAHLRDFYVMQGEFAASIDFTNAVFHGRTTFRNARFRRLVQFTGAVFHGGADFSSAIFGDWALFRGSKFLESAQFADSHFQGFAYFDDATLRSASFRGCQFSELASFMGAAFHFRSDFEGSTFLGPVDFRCLQMRGQGVFVNAVFAEPPYLQAAGFATDLIDHGNCIHAQGMIVEGYPELSGVSFLDWPGKWTGFRGSPQSPAPMEEWDSAPLLESSAE